ncbi:hypothetical protein CEXT_461251 [Caerostris extrusa]|uniref:Uncharacterized protein n=1 Tax=Caerostris extrusa TaxID=172846 RepID=A0AAV4UB08_CAEEX|nr:hypothetical protein CEXT_461251 [Caerostris extrusa]
METDILLLHSNVSKIQFNSFSKRNGRKSSVETGNRGVRGFGNLDRVYEFLVEPDCNYWFKASIIGEVWKRKEQYAVEVVSQGC